MKIGICAEFIGMKSGGPESYTVNLIKSFMEIDSGNEYNLYVIKQDVLNNYNIPSNFLIRPIRFYNSWIRNLVIMPIELTRSPVDILHVQYAVPLGFCGKLVATIHDIAFEFFPETFPKTMRYKLYTIVRRTAKKATVILTGSENTKKDLINLYGIPPEKIKVIHYAHGQIYKPVEDNDIFEGIKKKYKIPENFILYVGAIQPRKNIIGLIKAWEILREKYGLKWKLVIVGKAAWLSSEIIRSWESSKYSEDIIYTGYIMEEELPFIFNAADLFVYPSFYEGFGLTVLEAMACGIPVITSNYSSLPEVVGDAGLLIDPYNYEELAYAMYRVLTEPELRIHLSKKGLERSKNFSWRQTAEMTLNIYNKIFNG